VSIASVFFRGFIYDGIRPPAAGELEVVRGRVNSIRWGGGGRHMLKIGEVEIRSLTPLLLMPTFYDNHVHPLVHLSSRQYIAAPPGSRWNFREFAHWIRRRLKMGAPLVIGSLEENMFVEGRLPTGEDMEMLGITEPLLLVRVCGHRGYATEKALELLSEEDTFEPWQVDRAEGRVEEDALTLLRERILLQGSLKGMNEYSVHLLSLGISHAIAMVSFEEYERFRELPPPENIRLYFVPLLKDFLTRTSGMNREERILHLKRLRHSSLPVVGLKYIGDGSIGARTAHLREMYDDTATRGLDLIVEEEFMEGLELALRSSLTLFVHAIGDGAIEKTLRLYREFLDKKGMEPEEGRREGLLRIEHAELLPEDLLEVLGELQVPLCMQPNFIRRWQNPGGMYEEALGPQRLRHLNPIRSLVERGIALFFSSDSMPEDPLFGIKGAALHPTPGQSLPPSTALTFYQRGPLPPLRGSYLRLSVMEGNPASFTVVAPGGKRVVTVRGQRVYPGAEEAKVL